MRQVKGFVHRDRASELMHALEEGGFHRIAVFEAKGLQRPSAGGAVEYSVHLGDSVVSEAQVTVFCDDPEVQAVVEIFRRMVRSTHRETGWLYVTAIEQSIPLGAAQS